MRSIFSTKSFWVNTLTALALILALPEVSGLVPIQSVKYFIAIQAIVAVVMRRFADTPATFTGTGTGDGKLSDSGKRFIGIVLLATSFGASTSCALTAKSPTPVQQADARRQTAEIIERLTLGLQLVDQAAEAVRTSTLPPALKIEIGCEILQAVGVDNPPVTITSNCGTVPPRARAPLHVAVKTTQDLTTCASRQNTLAVAQQATRPIWEKLERSSILALQILGGALKYAIQPITVTCGDTA